MVVLHYGSFGIQENMVLKNFLANKFLLLVKKNKTIVINIKNNTLK